MKGCFNPSFCIQESSRQIQSFHLQCFVVSSQGYQALDFVNIVCNRPFNYAVIFAYWCSVYTGCIPNLAKQFTKGGSWPMDVGSQYSLARFSQLIIDLLNFNKGKSLSPLLN